jgi:hypothetical protein
LQFSLAIFLARAKVAHKMLMKITPSGFILEQEWNLFSLAVLLVPLYVSCGPDSSHM